METKVSRTKTSCDSCRTTKQKCDNQIPCRRCQLYGLECQSTGSASGSSAGVTRTPKTATRVHQPTSIRTDSNVDERLREISERLRSIEFSLQDSRSNHLQRSPEAGTLSASPHSSASVSVILKSNPLQTVSDTLVERIDAVASPAATADPIDRGLVTQADVELAFRFFLSNIQGWMMCFDETADSDPNVVRRRSPLLFSTILATATYYNCGAATTNESRRLYEDLILYVNLLIAPNIVSAIPHLMTIDFIKSLSLLLLWKPVQYNQHLLPNGAMDLEFAEQVGKINRYASSMMGGLCHRTAQLLLSSSITNDFASAYLAAYPSRIISPRIADSQRIWYWVLITDTHGAFQAGRPCTSTLPDLLDALKTTRLFASLDSAQVGDIRLAASVELFATAARCANDLQRFNEEMGLWEGYWSKPLRIALSKGDDLALTAYIFADFLRLALNIGVFTKWMNERDSMRGRELDILNAEEWEYLRIAIAAAERIIFHVSQESVHIRTASNRSPVWPARRTMGGREALHLDERIAAKYRTSFDTLSCVVYVFACVTLARLASEGLMRCELQLAIDDGLGYRKKEGKHYQLVKDGKLSRVLELGSEFLMAIAPNPSHPAARHSRLIRSLLLAGSLSLPEDPPTSSLTTLSTVAAAYLPAPTAPAPNLSFEPLRRSGPPLPQLNFSPTFYPNPFNGASATPPMLPTPSFVPLTDSGETTMASILSSLSPSYFEAMDYSTTIDAAQIDWDEIERSMNTATSGV